MSLIFNPEDWQELFQQTSQPQPKGLILDDFEKLWSLPELLGKGFGREIELSPGIRLQFSDCEYNQDFVIKAPMHDHPVQFMILLSGYYYSDIYPTFSKVRSYFSGSGMSPGYIEKFQAGQRMVSINVEIETKVLDSYLFADGQSRSTLRKQLYKGEDWKMAFYPTVTSKMRSLAHQLWNAPYNGVAKQMYLQGKVFELLALHLDLISADRQQIHSSLKLKPKTISSLYHAKDILTKKFEHPPSLPQLAQQVGVSQRTLQRGFPSLFKTTVVGYIAQQRLDRAEMLLQEGKYSVAEVAILVGYGNIGHFSVAFKGRFGITPSQCLAGQKADFEQTHGGF
ncbi:MAG: AraC family transcriptional regulator [Cyanobacteria bacterium P01_F01_bin.143]